jgi:hypothetical protein
MCHQSNFLGPTMTKTTMGSQNFKTISASYTCKTQKKTYFSSWWSWKMATPTSTDEQYRSPLGS